MSEFKREQFEKFWENTEVIRQYEQMLHTFGNTELPYMLAAQHPRYSDRTTVLKGKVVVEKPHILLPGHYGPQFKDGFEHSGAIPAQAAYIFRAIGLPYSNITNHLAAKEEIEYGTLSQTLDKLEKNMESHQDTETGLIKGLQGGLDISLMRYAVGLIIRSAPRNVSHFFEHLKKQQGKPIRPDEKVTDEDIRRLFEL